MQTDRLLRLRDIVGRPEITPEMAAANRARKQDNRRPRAAIPPMIPVAPATWWRWVKARIAPQPINFNGVTVWRQSDIDAFIAAQSAPTKK